MIPLLTRLRTGAQLAFIVGWNPIWISALSRCLTLLFVPHCASLSLFLLLPLLRMFSFSSPTARLSFSLSRGLFTNTRKLGRIHDITAQVRAARRPEGERRRQRDDESTALAAAIDPRWESDPGPPYFRFLTSRAPPQQWTRGRARSIPSRGKQKYSTWSYRNIPHFPFSLNSYNSENRAVLDIAFYTSSSSFKHSLLQNVKFY